MNIDIARLNRIGYDIIDKAYVEKYAPTEWYDYIDGFTYIGLVYDNKSREIGFKYYPAYGLIDANDLVTLTCPLWAEDLATFTDDQIIQATLEMEAER